MRTTIKEVVDKVQQHILDVIDTSDYEEHDGTLKTSLEIIKSEAQRTAFYPRNLQVYKSYQEAFRQWLLGLPTCLNAEFRTHKILKLMESWGLPLPEGKDHADAENLYYWLIYREFCKICRKNKVSFPN